MQSTLARLLALPDPLSEDGEEIDYPSLAFSPQELEEMSELLTGDFPGEPVTELEWDHAQVHSWRALGSTRDPKYLPLFLTLLRSALDAGDDLFLDEFAYWVEGMGAPAVAPLLAALSNPDEDPEYLEEIASTLGLLARAGAHQDEIHAAIVPLLARKSPARDLNSYLLGILIEFKAVEHLELIRTLFAENLINVEIIGDLETVEMDLGLRTKRSTPTPDYQKLEAKLSLAARREALGPLPDGKDHLAALDYLLQLYGSEDSIGSAVELDGFLLACAASPTPIPSSTYIPLIWDPEAANLQQLPAWESEQETALFYRSVQTLYNFHSSNLRKGEHSPLCHVIRVERREIPLYGDWCQGVALGAELWGPEARTLFEKLRVPLLAIVELESKEAPPRPQATESALNKCLSIIQNTFDERRVAPSRNPTPPPPGRNDPCPCGSGKKYKQCCMN